MFQLKSWFTKEAIIRHLKSLPILKTPVIDTIFSDRPCLPFPVVGADVVRSVVNAMPLVRRGAPSIAATQASGEIAFYEPLPVRPNVQVSAADLNNLKVLTTSGKDVWVREKTDLLRKVVRKTTEGMAAVALNGTISWPIQLEGGGFDTWVIDFGTILSVTPDTLWDAETCKLKDVFMLLTDMKEKIEEKGYGASVEIWAGSTAYNALFVIAENSKTTAKIRCEIADQGINVGGFLIKRRAEKYRNPQTKAMTSIIDPKEIKMIALDAGHKMPYCAVDDLDANLQAMPFFIKPVPIGDPSGYKLVAESKPFPIPNVEGICKAEVIS